MAGIVVAAIFLIGVPLGPDMGDPGDSALTIVHKTAGHLQLIRAWELAAGVASLATLVFGAALAVELWRSDRPHARLLGTLTASGAVAVMILTSLDHAARSALVYAVAQHRSTGEIGTLADLDYLTETMAHWGMLLLMGAGGLGTLVCLSRVPRWTGWLGLAGAVLSVGAVASTASAGVLTVYGVFVVLSLMVMLIWILSVSVALLRSGAGA